MDQRIEAIYDNGVFRPIGELVLPDHLRVVLRIVGDGTDRAEGDSSTVACQKRAMAALDAELETVPDNSPDDGLSSANHERILYGGGK